MGLFIFFSLNPCFLANSKLIISSVALLSNNASTVIPSCVSILSSSIFTVTSHSISLLFRLYALVFSTTLANMANLLLLRSSWGLLDFFPHLNFLVHIPVFFLLQFCFLFSYSYNFLLSVQILHNYNNSCFLFYLHTWHRGCIVWTLPSAAVGTIMT